MSEKLFDVVKESLFRKKSILWTLLLMGAVYVSLITAISSWDAITLTQKHYAIVGTLFFLSFVVYVIICLFHDRLPKAPKNSLAVLFVIDAESKQLFEDVQFKLIRNFKEATISDDSAHFHAIYITKDMVKKYNLQNKQSVLSLLNKTNCIFLVSVAYSVDDKNNAEEFELTIDYGVRHPKFDENAQAIFSSDLSTICSSVGRKRFSKRQTIDVFNFTANRLVHVCQYILGFVYLLSGHLQDACDILSHVRKMLSTVPVDTLGLKRLQHLIDDRLFATYAVMSHEAIQDFKQSHDISYLDFANKYLSIANDIRPETYFYHLNIAYVCIILDKNGKLAKAHIEKCKKVKNDKNWLYSEAFLSAYTGQAPATILLRYQIALHYPYDNPVDLIDYIELVLEREPEKKALHLAAGLIYEYVGDYMLMKQHFSIYLENTTDKRIKQNLAEKIDRVPCDFECDHNCSRCVHHAA